jgi:hypothetical protein
LTSIETTRPHRLRTRVAILVRGCFTNSGALVTGDWPIIGFEPVDPTTVEFPEALVGERAEHRFVRGEVSKPIALGYDEVRNINVYPTNVASVRIPLVCERYLGLSDNDVMGLEDGDLRYSPHRNQV